MPASFWTDPLMYQGGSDGFLGPMDDILAADEAWGIDLEGEVAIITGDVPYGCPVDRADEHIRLVMLCNDVSLRNLIPGEMAKGFGFFQSKPASAFSPVAVTPDELGGDWRDGRLHRPLLVMLNGERLGAPDAGADMVFSFPQLIAHAARTRVLTAGSIIGSGTVSNRDHGVGCAPCLTPCATVISALPPPARRTSPMRNSKARLDLDRFTPYRLSVLTNKVSSAIARHYSDRFDLSIPEWRVIAVLGQTPGLSAREVADRTAMDKVQVSRAVASLLAARRLTREAHHSDGRVAHLSLSPKGRAIYDEVVPLALDLEKRFLAVLSPRERQAFDSLLSKLFAGSANISD
jgi:2-keto-4-pentenoate hydratase/2-oxohepta-3-ene-1,7-dioic acid hydratase in catechol pathway/DNA-binding MarR family transcriptional regulator